jgi:uncharacterized membrane protein YkvA (DUF1232 family)
MISAWKSGRYRTVPWHTIAFGAVLLLYLFSPIDVIPDYLPFVGVIDDGILLGFFVRSVVKEVKRFRVWEEGQASHPE